MTDEQIMTALECCSTKHCSQCPSYDEDFGCDENTIKAAIDLINRQKAEIEELRSDKIIAERRKKE